MSSCRERCWTRKFDSDSEAFEEDYSRLQSGERVLRQIDLKIGGS